MAFGYAGQPLKPSTLMPMGMDASEFYYGLAGAAILLIGVGVLSRFSQRKRTSMRVHAIHERRKELRGELVGPRRRRKPETSVNFMRKVVTRFQLLKKSQVGKTEELLVEAGFRSKDAIFVLTFFNVVLPVVLAIVGLIVMKALPITSVRWRAFNYMWPVLGAYLGLKLPSYYVKRHRKKRYLKIQRSLSDVLDLMTICAEAGLSLAASLDRVSRELMISYPEMAEELTMTGMELGFLPDRNVALSNLAKRCQLPEVRGVVSVLIQTEKYGTPIAQALRVLAAEFRQARMLRAEQKAARLPALMTIPMIVFILPTLFIVIISPAVVKLMDTMSRM
jgi:tight adherence protein C